MPKKSAARKKTSAKNIQSLPWSVYFMGLSVLLNIYLIFTSYSLGNPILSPLSAACTGILTVLFVGYEARTKGNQFLALVFAGLTVLFSYLTSSNSNLASWEAITTGSAAIALVFLFWEKYGTR